MNRGARSAARGHWLWGAALGGLGWLAGPAIGAAAQEPGAAQERLPASTPRFRALVLETFGSADCATHEEAVAVNALGETAGSVCAEGRSRAASWTAAGRLTALLDVELSGDSFASDISDRGVVVGSVVQGGARTPLLWSAGLGRVELDLAPGAIPFALNAEGVVAYSFPVERAVRGALWSPSAGISELAGLAGDVLVRALNASGSVTGIAGGGSTPARPFLRCGGGALVELQLPAGFEHGHGNGINDADSVVGLCRDESGERAALWSPGEAPVLLELLREGASGAAFAVNLSGWVVGLESELESPRRASRAVLWIGGRALELERLVDPDPLLGPIEIDVAWDVNERGQIAARGRLGGQPRALRLDPF